MFHSSGRSWKPCNGYYAPGHGDAGADGAHFGLVPGEPGPGWCG